jgi:hypothetical protein
MTTLNDHGFIRVHCDTCANPDVWLKCDQCTKSTNFLLEEDRFRCHCGATYGHAVCTCGAQVGRQGLTFVPFDEGPLSLTDLSISWTRVAVLLTGLAGLAWGIWYFITQSLG